MRRLVGVIAASVLVAMLGAAPGAANGIGDDPQWGWPAAEPHSVIRPYIAPATPYSAGHRGIDVLVPDGLVYAPAAGVVHFAGDVVDRPVLSISHEGGLLSSYEPLATDLVAGDVVSRGDVIGNLEPGHCSEPCLHFGVRLNGEYLSPLNFLGGIPRSVLLPTRTLW